MTRPPAILARSSSQDLTRIRLGICLSLAAGTQAGSPAIRAPSVRAAFEKGVTFFDTAEVEGPYQTKNWSDKHSRLSETKSSSQD